MPIACIGGSSGALHLEVAGPLNREIQIIPCASDHSLCRVDLSVANLAERICSLVQCRHSAVSTRFGQNRPEDILLAAETGTTAIRHVGSDGIQCLGSCHQAGAGAIKSAIHGILLQTSSALIGQLGVGFSTIFETTCHKGASCDSSLGYCLMEGVRDEISRILEADGLSAGADGEGGAVGTAELEGGRGRVQA